jgi:hypothetical protein
MQNMFVYEGNSHEIEKLLVLMLTMACVSAAFFVFVFCLETLIYGSCESQLFSHERGCRPYVH